MQRIKSLNGYQKGLLLLLLAMALVFAVVYHATVSRVGILYQDTIFVPEEEGGVSVYSGKIRGERAQITVSEGRSVVFQCGDKTYDPYTVREDPTALPELEIGRDSMTGVEIREGEKLLFRGGFWQSGEDYWLFNEDGDVELPRIAYTTDDGVQRDADGNAVDPLEPSLPDILRLVYGPELTHKGSWLAWLSAVFISFLAAGSILYADELFRFNLSFQIQNAEAAEPSEWEMVGRYISWTVFAIAALVIYFLGLQ